MPKVTSEIFISGHSLGEVWDVVSAFDRYPESMSNVISVRFSERSESSAVSDWTIMLNGTELTWLEKDLFFPNSKISFEALDGDLEMFKGEWNLQENQGGVDVRLEVEFEIGIPSLSQVLDPVGSAAIKENSEAMLMSIQQSLH